MPKFYDEVADHLSTRPVHWTTNAALALKKEIEAGTIGVQAAKKIDNFILRNTPERRLIRRKPR